MSLLLATLLLLQIGVNNDVAELRAYLGKTYAATIQALNAKNEILLRNTGRLAPAQAAEMRARMQAPAALAKGSAVLTARIDNIGQGFLSFLFDDDFITEQVNFVFCPAQADLPERLIAMQILIDDSRAVRSATALLQNVYQLPPPLPPNTQYQTALPYPVAANLPVTLWNLGTAEAAYQPVRGNRLVTGQLWLTDKGVAMSCSAIPKLSPFNQTR